jgi:radical SAM protein with 4Fe4S-binding SPASM domain
MLLPWIGCQAGLTALGIQSDGGVKGCLSLPDSFIEGNIRQRSLIDIWKDPALFSYNRAFNLDDLENQCKVCKHSKKCKGGCVTVSSTLTGKNHCNPYCLNAIEEEILK